MALLNLSSALCWRRYGIQILRFSKPALVPSLVVLGGGALSICALDSSAYSSRWVCSQATTKCSLSTEIRPASHHELDKFGGFFEDPVFDKAIHIVDHFICPQNE
jgi:hypothetical protein